MNLKNKKLLFVITEYWYFISHRNELAKFLSKKGYKIYLLTNLNIKKKLSNQNIFSNYNIEVINWNINRESKNIYKELISIFKIFKTYKLVKPNYVYSVGIKPILYCALLSRFFNNISFVYAFAGLGSLFIYQNFKNKLFQNIIFGLLKIFMKNHKSKIIFQNIDDKNYFNGKINKSIEQVIIKGSGVNTKYFNITKNIIESNFVNVTLLSRFLYDKGVLDFISIAENIKKINKNINFYLVGREDFKNPSALKVNDLLKYEKNKTIKIINNPKKVLDIYKFTDIICFPSFREGLPKSLLESSSCSIPSVVYDVPGSKEVVVNNLTGYVVKFRDLQEMQNRIIDLIKNKTKRIAYGKSAREYIIKNYDENIILNKIYSEIENMY